MSTLKEQAEALGIQVNGRWSDETLQKKIDEAKTAKVQQTAQAQQTPNDPAKPVADDGSALKTEETPKASKANVTLDAKTRLIITAEELNIEVDEDWDEDRLRAEIQMAREGRADLQIKGAVPPAEYGKVDYDPATAADKTPYTLKRAYWDESGNRIDVGSEVHLNDDEARRLGRNVLDVKSVL